MVGLVDFVCAVLLLLRLERQGWKKSSFEGVFLTTALHCTGFV